MVPARHGENTNERKREREREREGEGRGRTTGERKRDRDVEESQPPPSLKPCEKAGFSLLRDDEPRRRRTKIQKSSGVTTYRALRSTSRWPIIPSNPIKLAARFFETLLPQSQPAIANQK